MQKIWMLLFFVACFQMSSAQYTELINSRRPGFSDSPFGVGTDVLQIETGLFYENHSEDLIKTSALGTDIMVRYGKFLEKLEVNLNLTFQYDRIKFVNLSDSNFNELGLTQLTVGAKYLVYMPKYADKSKEIRSWKKRTSFDWKRLIPSVAVYAGANIPVTRNFIGGNFSQYIDDTFSPRVAIYTQSDITDRFVFLMNLVADRIGSDQKENSYILTGTYTLTDKWSVFAEHQGIFKGDMIPNDYQFGGGAAYLLSKNMQVDASIRTISDRDGSTFLFGGGFSWRLDKHEDKFNLLDSKGNVTKDKKEGNFFSRLLGKNKDPELRKVKKVKAKKRKIKVDKPKKTKAQKEKEKRLKKSAKEERKKNKKAKKDYKKNYEPPKNESPE